MTDSGSSARTEPARPHPRLARYTTSTALLEALREAGVRYAFANLGSDHTGILEAYALASRLGTLDTLPELVLCPHESVALSAAQGYAQVSGEAQAVLVHVDCGTQNLGGAIHNASRGRVPVLIFAGLSPMTQEGELPGSRTEFIHWLQDSADQRGMLRGYAKYDQEIRTGRNVKQLVHRALQIARSEPAGPVYLTAAREVLEEELAPQPAQGPWWDPVAPAALADEVADEIAAALEDARSPLVVTSYLGRDPAAVAALTGLCELAGIGVLESVPMRMNFPADHPLQVGYHWNQPEQHPVLAEADVILVLGSDVPWIPAHNRPRPRRALLRRRRRPAQGRAAAVARPGHPVRPGRPGPRRRRSWRRGWRARAAGSRGRGGPGRAAAGRARRAAGRVGRPGAARRGRQHHPGVPGRLRPRGRARGRPVPDRGHHQLPGGQRAPGGQPAGLAARQRRRLAGLGRRRGRGRQAGRAGAHRGQPGRGRVVPVRRALVGALDGPALPGPLADRDPRQPGLEGAVAVHPGRAPGRGARGRAGSPPASSPRRTCPRWRPRRAARTRAR